jgi:hypothetical protein
MLLRISSDLVRNRLHFRHSKLFPAGIQMFPGFTILVRASTSHLQVTVRCRSVPSRSLLLSTGEWSGPGLDGCPGPIEVLKVKCPSSPGATSHPWRPIELPVRLL